MEHYSSHHYTNDRFLLIKGRTLSIVTALYEEQLIAGTYICIVYIIIIYMLRVQVSTSLFLSPHWWTFFSTLAQMGKVDKSLMAWL